MVIKLSSRNSTGWVDFWEVPSQSRPGKAYIVARRVNGDFGCDCPRWKFKRENCKHIQEVQSCIANPAILQNHAPITNSEKLKKILNAFSAIDMD